MSAEQRAETEQLSGVKIEKYTNFEIAKGNKRFGLDVYCRGLS
jgi:hypothetical protein